MRSFDELFAAADQLRTPVPVVAAGGADSTVIQALELARRRGWVRPMLSGDPRKIAEMAAGMDIDIAPFEIIEDEPDSAMQAVRCVHEGRAQLLMKGQIPTPSLMKAVLQREGGLRTGKTICQVVLMEIPRDRRTFLMSDTGVTIAPTPQQHGEILEAVIHVARRLGCPTPRIALMAATEKPVEAMPETLAQVELTARAEAGEFGPCSVQGPLSFDLAYTEVAGARKGIQGDVTGAADGMVFPNLLAANLTVKGIMYTADCRFGGILMGTSKPVVFMSRADNVETRLHSLAYALHTLS